MKEKFLIENLFGKLSLFKKFNDKEEKGLGKNGEISKTEKVTAEVFNNFFGNAVKILNISRYPDLDPIIENVKDPTFKTILKYKKHPTIIHKIFEKHL